MINALLESSDCNPFVRDVTGKSPIHIAAAKLNREIFEKLIRITGADPMMPDADGNTFLHIMALGVIKDTEYDFIKQMVIRHGLRLTCNKEGRTPMNLMKTNSGVSIALRG
jgi:ankyrin repeat protein